MRLIKMKVVGFKSFVDPTNVLFPSNLIAVVGPNGCGKSNIIDAVRWVLGESSAKYLRGENMADVIFSGSSTRKPVGQASVELIFDNSDAAIGGPYAKYAEVSIKRLVNRDGQSTYYLNGSKCRLKDVRAILLGTGLGSRSYSIIEQGTISKLIEAKPEQLREYLEEAAGISKYKERRRETENRIRRTRDNLERLEDIRQELGKQIERLQRQAKAAGRYKILRQEERLMKGQLSALRWQHLHEQLTQQDKLISEQELQLEALITQQRHYDTEIEKHRVAHTEANDQFNELQTEYYRIGSEIARLEEAIQHQRERKQQLEEDISQTHSEITRVEEQLDQDKFQSNELREDILRLEPEYEQSQTLYANTTQGLGSAEQANHDWQQAWDAFNQTAAESSKQAHVEQTKIQHLEQRLSRLQKQIDKLNEEGERYDLIPLQQDIEQLQQVQSQLQTSQDEEQSLLTQIQDQMIQQRQKNKDLLEQFDNQKTQLHSLQAEHASVEALQQAALGKRDKIVRDWLVKHNLADQQRLAEMLRVETGWERAVETVLGDYLQAVCLDETESLIADLIDLPEGRITLVAAKSLVPTHSSSNVTCLLTKVMTDIPGIQGILGRIFIAESIDAALLLQNQLAAHESIITQEGIWIGPGWVRVSKAHDAQAGIIEREQTLTTLHKKIEHVQTLVESLEEQLTSGREMLLELEIQRDQQQMKCQQLASQMSDQAAQSRVKQGRLEQIQQRLNAIQQELTDLQEQQANAQSDLLSARNTWQEAMQAMEHDADKRQNLMQTREQITERLESVRRQAQHERDKTHELELRLQASKTQLAGLKDNMQRLEERIDQLKTRHDGLNIALEQAVSPAQDIGEQLKEKLELHSTKEKVVKHARQQVESIEQQLTTFEEQRQQADQEARTLQGKLEQVRLDGQGVRVRCATIEEQLAEIEFELTRLLEEMPETANTEAWEEELQRMATRIQRLGAINLAAIDEFKTESERKTYLDRQYDDLTDALNTLENAIRKIDKETRERFKETYDQVNDSFKTLFPRLFGGGNAYLELTGDDLLDAGVGVIARPPGKRNSSINVLSGGEKAMTAVALVFAIFQLNPSPFCLLDEVDAPLDDANVARFCNMVKEMSSQVQFIFITHNKLTMELADHLTGVTMNEPGVSRLVSVDVDEAVSLAEA